MRFGKRLAEVTQHGNASEPYVAYKNLKQILNELSRLIAGASELHRSSDEGSSPEESLTDSMVIGALESGTLQGNGQSMAAKLEAYQGEFYRKLDADVAQAIFHVQSAVASLEVVVGQWQAVAIVAGLLFTPEQLDDVAEQLPFQVQNQDTPVQHMVLIDWLRQLQPDAKAQASRRSLVEKYWVIATTVNNLLQYIEVNLTAVRKILKKFKKKVPAEMRIASLKEYKAHHRLLMPSMQDLLVSVVQIQRVVTTGWSQPLEPDITGMAVPIAQMGPETMTILTWQQGPAALDDTLGRSSAMRIDVYAKPSGDTTAAPGPGAPKRGSSASIGGTAAIAAASSGSAAGEGSGGYPAQQRSAAGGSTGSGASAGAGERQGAGAGDRQGAARPGPVALAVGPCNAVAAAAVNATLRTDQAPAQQEQGSKGGRRRGGQRGGGRGRKGSGAAAGANNAAATPPGAGGGVGGGGGGGSGVGSGSGASHRGVGGHGGGLSSGATGSCAAATSAASGLSALSLGSTATSGGGVSSAFGGWGGAGFEHLYANGVGGLVGAGLQPPCFPPMVYAGGYKGWHGGQDGGVAGMAGHPPVMGAPVRDSGVLNGGIPVMQMDPNLLAAMMPMSCKWTPAWMQR